MKTTTPTFRLLKRLHLIESEEKHGRINPLSLVWFAVRTLWRRTIFTYAYKAYILEFAYKHHLRPAIWTVATGVPAVYNVAPYVERCLSSVMRQSLPATECIIVDDASTDDSVNRCRRLIDGYSGCTRFTILHHDTNRGLSAARNTGTDASTSSHIYYLDSDDEMTPDCLQKLAAPITRDDTVEMVMGSSRRDWSDMHGRRARLKQRININRARWQSQHPHKPLQLNSNDAVYRWYFIRCLRHAVIIPDVTYIHHQRPASIITGNNTHSTSSSTRCPSAITSALSGK